MVFCVRMRAISIYRMNGLMMIDWFLRSVAFVCYEQFNLKCNYSPYMLLTPATVTQAVPPLTTTITR